MIQVRVRYFAAVREALGPGQELAVPEHTTVAQLRDLLCGLSAAHTQALQPASLIRAAVDQTLSSEGGLVHDGSEVAFFPPVTGG